jgi:polyisoprenyl-phosphate glycosyltransferase
MLLSIVIPVYQAENILGELINRIKNTVKNITSSYQVVLVDDGSTDRSWEVIETICIAEPNITAIKLSRNFGQHHAITAGLDICAADWVVVMDCDLQDKPEEISNLYYKALEGYDIVFAKRFNRQDTFWTKFFSKMFFKIYGYLTGMKHDASIANFGIYNRKVVEVIKNMKEPMRAFFPMVKWVGFNNTSINVEHVRRKHGKSMATANKRINLALDIFLSYSDKPLKIIVSIGFLISLCSFIAAFGLLYKYFFGHVVVLGYTSIMISIWFLSGLIIFILGIIGLYISKIFSGIKNRPLYIIDKQIN